MKTHLCLFTITAALAMLTQSASAVMITFEGVAPSGGVSGIPITPYTENGFTLTADTVDTAIFSPPYAEPPSAGFMSDYFTFNAPTTTVTLASASAVPFTLNSFDLGIGAASDTLAPVDVTLTGNLFGGGIVSRTFNSVFAVANQELNWTNLSSVVITGTDDLGIDNIMLDGPISGVPEGGTTAPMMGLALFGLVAARKRLG